MAKEEMKTGQVRFSFKFEDEEATDYLREIYCLIQQGWKLCNKIPENPDPENVHVVLLAQPEKWKPTRKKRSPNMKMRAFSEVW